MTRITDRLAILGLLGRTAVAWIVMSGAILALCAGPAMAVDAVDDSSYHPTGFVEPVPTASPTAFGSAVAISGDTMVVGAHGDDDNGTNAGAAFVYALVGDEWQQQARLEPIGAAEDDHFGSAVDIDGDRIVVGAPGTDTMSGSVFVFERVGETWQQAAELKASHLDAYAQLGCSVALDGGMIVAGAPAEHNLTGAAYLFGYEYSWTEIERFTASDGESPDTFGYRVDIHKGDSLWGDAQVVISAVGWDDEPHCGAVYTYYYDGPATGFLWHEDIIVAPDGAEGDMLGSAVSLDGDYLAVGAYGTGDGEGSVYIFRGNPTGMYSDPFIW